METNQVISRAIKPSLTSLPIDLAIVTTARPKDYIHQLLSCLRSGLPLRIVVGGPDVAYLERHRLGPCVDIVAPPEEEWTRFIGCPVHHRATWNYWRGLALGPSSKECKGLLIFEDDVIVATGWEARLHNTVRELEATSQGGFVLALYAASALTPVPGHFYAPYPARRFFGTQAMYYPEAIRRGFAEYLRANGVDRHVHPYDLLLRTYLQSHGVSLFATVPCLAQHVGEISTGLGGFHKAANFQDVL